MEIPDLLTCFLRNLYVSQEGTVRTGHGAVHWFQIGKGVHQGCILSPCLFNLYAEYMMWNAGLDEAQTGSKLARRNTSNFRYAHDTTLMTKSKEQRGNSLLMRVKEESKETDLKLSIQKNEDYGIRSYHFMANRWGNNGNSDQVYFFGLKNQYGQWMFDGSYKIKRCLLLRRKTMTNLHSVLKSRDKIKK